MAAWNWVVSPEIQDAADRAVDDRVAEFEATAPTTVVVSTSTTLPVDEPDPVGPVALGDPVSYRIPVDVGITQERSESIAVPPDSEFLLTDLVLQNPNGDLGTARLLRNGDVLYTWDLGAMNSANEFQPRVSPLPFGPTDNIVLSVAVRGGGQAHRHRLRDRRAARRHAGGRHRLRRRPRPSPGRTPARQARSVPARRARRSSSCRRHRPGPWQRAGGARCESWPA